VRIGISRGRPDRIDARMYRKVQPGLWFNSPSETGRNDQCLVEWMCMPGGAGTRLKPDAGANSACWSGDLKQRVMMTSPMKYSVGPLVEG
jgi:hypothetical protein